MLKEILTAALAIVAAWLLIALLPSLFEVGIGLMLLAGLFWLASVISFGWLPSSVPVSSPVVARLDPARGSD